MSAVKIFMDTASELHVDTYNVTHEIHICKSHCVNSLLDTVKSFKFCNQSKWGKMWVTEEELFLFLLDFFVDNLLNYEMILLQCTLLQFCWYRGCMLGLESIRILYCYMTPKSAGWIRNCIIFIAQNTLKLICQLPTNHHWWPMGGCSESQAPVNFCSKLCSAYYIFLSFLHSVPRLAACTSMVAWWTSMRTRELALCLRSGWLCPACWSYAGRSSSRLFPTWLHFPPCSCSTWASHRNSLNAWNRPHHGGRTNEWMGRAGLDWEEMTEHRI